MSVRSDAVEESSAGERTLPGWSRHRDVAGMAATAPLALFADRLPVAVSWLVVGVLAVRWWLRVVRSQRPVVSELP